MNTEEWMGCVRKKQNKSDYTEDRRLNEKFINGINDDDMMTEIMRGLTAVRNTNEITSEHILCWARRVRVQRVQKAILDVKKGSKEFDAIKIQSV